MSLISYFNRPEYLFQPKQIFLRLIRSSVEKSNKTKHIFLPWKAKIKIHPNEVIGRSIWVMGIYDLSVTEVIWRLVSQNETAIDIGANIGYMTSIMARKVGKYGKVYSFEPHPEIYQELSENIINWQNELGWNHIEYWNNAISSSSGEGYLKIPKEFEKNRGVASLVSSNVMDKNKFEFRQYNGITINLVKLEDVIDYQNIGVVKIDVEGHELEVLKGANELIRKQIIRDILFEEHQQYPSIVTQFLENNGYTIFKICKGFWQPILKVPVNEDEPSTWEPQNYLATINPLRAVERMQPKGWFSLFNKDLIV